MFARLPGSRSGSRRRPNDRQRGGLPTGTRRRRRSAVPVDRRGSVGWNRPTGCRSEADGGKAAADLAHPQEVRTEERAVPPPPTDLAAGDPPAPGTSCASNSRVASAIVSLGRFGVMHRGRGALLGNSGLLAALRDRGRDAPRGIAARGPELPPGRRGVLLGPPPGVGGRGVAGVAPVFPDSLPWGLTGHRRRQVTDAGPDFLSRRLRSPVVAGASPDRGRDPDSRVGARLSVPRGRRPARAGPRTRGEGWLWRAPGAVRRRDCLSRCRDSR